MKKAIACISMVATALALCSCGGSGASPAAKNAAGASGVTEVSVWHYWDGTNADTFDAMVDKFNSEHKDIKVTTTSVPNADYLTKLRASASSNSLPDISIGDLIWVPQIAQMGKSADISKVLDSKLLADINPALASFGSIDGKQVSVPVSGNNLAYMYNRTLFKDAGLDPNQPPKTWEELKTMGKQILDKTGKPGYDLLTEAGDNGEGLTWNFQVNLWQAGGEFLTADNSKAAFNTPEGKKAAQFWVDLIKAGISPYASWGKFEKGQGGSAQEGSWMVGIWAADPPFDFDVAQLPVPEGGKQVTNLGGEQAMIFDNDAKKVAAAGKFLSWFLDDAQMIDWNEKTGFIPVRNSIASGEEYRSWVEKNEKRLMPFVEQMKYAKARPNTPLYPQISMAFAKEMEKAFAGDLSVDEALTNAEKAVNDVIAKGKK
ncbi:ABC transporter substrate-binding protein [Mobiluncus mulieris]|uniref:ABC transporter substrate-binding protein n=1 Tax=Mobiluncus mulieris TaxID=2052 RepID=A0A7Y0U1L1_9ACTO|nr:ABC transporter substrate-binding protein [Mobiluncus mulieris]NMW65265.1 ABC transporter substrate-binding protein [Mobiluncus mulieris]